MLAALIALYLLAIATDTVEGNGRNRSVSTTIIPPLYGEHVFHSYVVGLRKPLISFCCARSRRNAWGNRHVLP